MRIPPFGAGIALIVSTGGLLAADPETPAGPRRLDARFEADRVLVDVPIAGGGKLRMFTDTGGGGVLLYSTTVSRLGLATRPVPEGGDAPPGAAEVMQLLEVAAGTAPPFPAKILVAPDPFAGMGVEDDADGMAGQSWFAGHVWTWDYPRGTLSLERDGWHRPAGARSLPVTFRRTQGGVGLHFPRIVVEIAGVPTSMLFDTGATTVLTPEAAASIGGPRVRGTSMITASTIAGWRRAHPEWRVVENAQIRTGARMIEVPDVRIAGFQVGPVWFTERPDANFRKFMSSMTDAPVEGAIGGNALRTLRVTVDYLHATGAVAQPSSGRPG